MALRPGRRHPPEPAVSLDRMASASQHSDNKKTVMTTQAPTFGGHDGRPPHSHTFPLPCNTVVQHALRVLDSMQ